MRIAILSDPHANLPALKAVLDHAGQVDALLCLGDLVDYGPHPKEVLSEIRKRATSTIRGNHDQALAYDVDCGCAPAFKTLSLETRAYHKTLLGPEDIDFLKALPLSHRAVLGGVRFFLCHASPQGDLFRYLPPSVPEEVFRREVSGIEADVILTGHTHLPMIRKVGRHLIINPGSVGQPRDGNPTASYAVWEDGDVEVRRVGYPIDETIEGLHRSPLPRETVDRLCAILKKGK